MSVTKIVVLQVSMTEMSACLCDREDVDCETGF